MERSRSIRVLAFAVLTAALAMLLYHLRALSPPSADSVEISHFVERDIWVWYLRWPLTHLMAQAIHQSLGLSGADSLALLSSIGGALFLMTIATLVRRSPLILVVLLSSVTLTLVGHVEVYAWPMLALLWLLLLVPMHLRGAMPLAPLVTLFGFGCLMHMLVVFYAPVLIWTAITARRRALERGVAREVLDADMRRALGRGLLFLLIIALMPLAMTPGGLNNDLERLVPLTAPETLRSSNQVTLFSPAHLMAMGIFLVISCPIGLPLALVRIRRLWSSDTIRATAIAAGCGLLFLVIWHPDMGWRGDWDLFSHPGLAINVLAWRLWEGGMRRTA